MSKNNVGRPKIEIDPDIVACVYREEGNVREAGKRLGISPSTVHRILKRHGKVRKKLKWVFVE